MYRSMAEEGPRPPRAAPLSSIMNLCYLPHSTTCANSQAPSPLAPRSWPAHAPRLALPRLPLCTACAAKSSETCALL